MPKVIRTRVIGTKTILTEVKCQSCGGVIKSTDKMCPNCEAPRPTKYTHDQVKETGIEITGDDLKRVKAGADNCPACGSLDWKYDREANGYACTQCGYGTGEKTDYEMAGGKIEAESLPKPKVSSPQATVSPQFSTPKKDILIKPWMYGVGLVVVLLFSCLIWALTNTHPVNGNVASVEWQITAHQEELQLKNGEGPYPPAQATITSSKQELYDWEDNQIGETHGQYYVTSTLEQTGHTHGEDVAVETPGAIYTSIPYICSGPTMEAGASVTYDMCSDDIQDDPTWGYEESPETPVYAPQVDVLQTTMPTPVYGTPTPLYRTYYYYNFWEWTNVGSLNSTYGYDNYPYSPSGQTDDYHRVVEDSHFYKVTIEYDNGEQAVYEGSDPGLLTKYILGEPVIGYFNALGGLNSDNQ